MSFEEARRCQICGFKKPLSHFYQLSKNRFQAHNICKPCMRGDQGQQLRPASAKLAGQIAFVLDQVDKMRRPKC